MRSRSRWKPASSRRSPISAPLCHRAQSNVWSTSRFLNAGVIAELAREKFSSPTPKANCPCAASYAESVVSTKGKRRNLRQRKPPRRNRNRIDVQGNEEDLWRRRKARRRRSALRPGRLPRRRLDRKSTRLNSSHL